MRKNTMKKIGALALAALTGVSTVSFAACGNSAAEEAKKKNSTILNVKIFNGGLGYAWLQQIAEKFMETFKDVSFEEGKQGVYISITPNKSFNDLHMNMQTGADSEDLYYTATNDVQSFVNADVAYDLTDVMTANVYDENGNVKLNATGDGWATQSKSIVDRISIDYYRQAFNFGDEANPTYYAVPYEDSISGFIVDWDLFKQEGWNSYDGIDGMPATFEDFYDLLYRIQKTGFSAFTYSSSVGYYTSCFQSAIQAKVDGSDFYTDVSSDYTADYDFNGDGTISDDEKITPKTIEKLLDTKGYRAAVEMVAELFKSENGNTYYDPNVVQGVSFGGAQQDFVMSKNSSSRKRIAMIYEGDWWENETRATFNSMGRLNDADGYGQREFRMMPIPAYSSSDKNEKNTIGSFSSGYAVIANKKTLAKSESKQRVLELFLQYQYASEGLKTFTKASGSALPFDYSMTEDELATLTPFARNMWELRHNDQVEIIRNNPHMRSREVRLAERTIGFSTKISGVSYDTSLFNNYMTFCMAGKTVTPDSYIQGMHAYYDGTFADVFD